MYLVWGQCLLLFLSLYTTKLSRNPYAPGRQAVAFVGLATAPLVGAQSQVTLSSLQVENKDEPLGIDVIPRFSWIITSPQRGTSQTSYRIRISTSSAGGSDVWDSGTINSNKPYGALYSGPSLTSDTRYFWAVDATTTAGSASASSQFVTGLLSPADWGSSKWIGKGGPTQRTPDALITAFKAASWVWTSETSPPNAPAEDRAFRKTAVSPGGKTATSAIILMTVDDIFTLYVNGVLVGSSPNTTDIWKSAQRFDVTLNPTSNLFAVRGINRPDASNGGPSPAGLLAAIQITYSDGTTAIIASDASWKAIKVIPANFQSPSTDDSSWSPAVALAQYGSGPWGSGVAVPTTVTTTTLSLSDSTWIWTTETSPPNAPPGPRAFRKTHSTPSGKTATRAKILITADDLFDLYINGVLIGSAPDVADVWRSAQPFQANLQPSTNLFAVRATNRPDVSTGGDGPAGLLVAIEITYTDGTAETIRSDTSWRANKSVQSGFELPATDDSSWPLAASLGKYGVSPWNSDVSVSDPLGEHPAPLLRKEFSVSKTIAFARLYYAVGGFASITLNGAPASNHVLTPGFTNYDKQAQYVALDVTSKLKTGANAVGIELGRSHYAVTQSNVWSWDRAPWRAEPCVRAVLSLGYTDGSTERVTTDQAWQVREGPTRLDDVFGGENYDAQYALPGYDQAGFNATSWQAAQVVDGPKGVLLNERQPPIRIVQSLTPVSVTQPVAGKYVVAFERVVAGWVQIKASGPAHSLITLHFGEKLKPDGTVIYEDTSHYFANNFQTDRFWLAGTGAEENFEPKFSYKGFQYVQIEGWPGSAPPTQASIIGKVVHNDLASRGGFESSSDLLNKMHLAVVRTMLNNVHSIPEDCPTFEKNGWSGDAMLGTEMFLTTLDAHDLLAKYVRDLDESRPGGSGPPGVIAPDSGWGSNNQAPTWHSAFIFIPWWLYQYRGDRRVLEEHYDSMKNYVQFELGRSPNNIASTGLGDWVSPETSPAGGNAPEDSRISATAFLHEMLLTMNKIAVTLEKSGDAATFASQASNVKTAFNNAFFKSANGYYAGVNDNGYRQTHNLLALSFGLAPDNTTAQSVAESIVNDVAARGTHLNTGALGTKHLLPILTEYGHADVAAAVAMQTTYPSWGYWIANGANTMWEHWSSEARSRDHLFLGTFEDWLFKHVVGIKIGSVAYEETIVAPAVTSHLDWARGWTLTPFGNFSVQWENTGNSFQITVTVPTGVRAALTLPGALQVTESGRALDQSEGVLVVGTEAGAVLVSVGSGSYSFVSTT